MIGWRGASLRGCEVHRGRDGFAVLSVPIYDEEALDRLTEAERDIVGRILCGQGNRQIADDRGSRLTTVRNQIHTIFEKLGVGSRTQLAAALVARVSPADRGRDG